MSETFTWMICLIVLAFMFAYFFRQAVVYFKEDSYFMCGLNVALCIWEAAKLVELCLTM